MQPPVESLVRVRREPAVAPGRVALAHDYLTQRGGAERVVLSLVRAFPGAPLYTSLFEPASTYPEFGAVDVRPLSLNKLGLFRHHHRLALPVLAPAFSRLQLPPDTDVVICSSSGWAHGISVDARKIVYCHTPARWLYQPDRYLGSAGRLARATQNALRTRLRDWDQRGALSADVYLANSTWVAKQIRRIYGIEPRLLHPPMSLDVAGPQRQPEGVEPGYILCVSRLLPYKNVDAIVEACTSLGRERLVVVGTGPDLERLRHLESKGVHFTGMVEEPELRWLYANARCLVAASYEDFGLTPIEAAAFGKPTAALRFGGFLDTVQEDDTGVFFEAPKPREIADALARLLRGSWSESEIEDHAAEFSEARFAERIREIAAS
jgi:glycosyltransferase involved in cell wall biosynthesis